VEEKKRLERGLMGSTRREKIKVSGEKGLIPTDIKGKGRGGERRELKKKTKDHKGQEKKVLEGGRRTTFWDQHNFSFGDHISRKIILSRGSIYWGGSIRKGNSLIICCLLSPSLKGGSSKLIWEEKEKGRIRGRRWFIAQPVKCVSFRENFLWRKRGEIL